MENRLFEKILLMRERAKNFFQKHYGVMVPVLKLLEGIIAFFVLNQLYGYSRIWSSVWFLIFMVGLFVVIPTRYGWIVTSIFILLNLINVSIDVMALYFMFLLIIYLLILRVIPQYSWIMIAVPVLFYFKLSCLVPILIGMFCGISAILVMMLGAVTYFFADYVREIVVLLNSASQKETVVAFRKIIQLMSVDYEFMLTLFILCLVFVITYVLYRSARNYAWHLAIFFGGITHLILRLMQTLLLEADINIWGVILSTSFGILLALAIQFFRCVIDYSRSEKIQFEDDEYYYYVKIVPKISVKEKDVNVKKISSSSKGVKKKNTSK